MTNDFTPTKYVLESVQSGRQFSDTGWTLDAPQETTPGLIRAVYEQNRLTVGDAGLGIFRFAGWLPVQRCLTGSSAPITYRSEALGKLLGLDQLFITFSGYWPEKRAFMRTCSFKETEAFSVCGRLNRDTQDVLVVASAGNTARAFARVCSDNDIPLLLCVPADNLDALWFDEPVKDHVRLLCTPPGSDYYDAIFLSGLISCMPGFFPEGGAKNVARRDGMGTTVLSAAHVIGRIPDYYFQAVGSGTGAIAAWEANQRLIADGRFGSHKMKLMVSQNIPFIPLYEAWKAGSRQLMPMDDELARQQVEAIDAKVLSNRKPPYSLAGGLFDALSDSGGDVLLSTNEEAAEAAALFEQLEGIDIHPAAAIATASLIKEAAAGRIPRDACVMLNITGGGEKRFRQDNKLCFMKPDHVFDKNFTLEDVKQII